MENIINTKQNTGRATIKVSHDASSQYAKLAKDWAVSENIINGEDYSAKYYANQSKNSAKDVVDAVSSASDIIENLNSVKGEITSAQETALSAVSNAQTEAETSISAQKTAAISDISAQEATSVANVVAAGTQAVVSVTEEKDAALKEIQAGVNVSVATTEIAGIVKPDGTTITIAEDGTISSVGGGSSGSGSSGSDVYIVEDFYSSDKRSWYRVWSDGIVEQGGEALIYPKKSSKAAFLVNMNHSAYPVHLVYSPITIDDLITDDYLGLGENADFYSVDLSSYMTWENTINLNGFTIYNTGNVIFNAIWYARGKKVSA